MSEAVRHIWAMEDDIAILKNKVKKLNEALDIYGQHLPNCQAQFFKKAPCICGYSEIIGDYTK